MAASNHKRVSLCLLQIQFGHKNHSIIYVNMMGMPFMAHKNIHTHTYIHTLQVEIWYTIMSSTTLMGKVIKGKIRLHSCNSTSLCFLFKPLDGEVLLSLSLTFPSSAFPPLYLFTLFLAPPHSFTLLSISSNKPIAESLCSSTLRLTSVSELTRERNRKKEGERERQVK